MLGDDTMYVAWIKRRLPLTMKLWMREQLQSIGYAPVGQDAGPPEAEDSAPAPENSELQMLRAALAEQFSYRKQDTVDLMTLFNAHYGLRLHLDGKSLHRMARVAGTTLLEAAFILKGLDATKHLDGDWCEYGVAHGRTSALLAEMMIQQSNSRKLWLYDSFEGLPEPHTKDVMLHDIFGIGSMSAYRGTLSFPEEILKRELASVSDDNDRFKICKGWITPQSLLLHSPDRITFAYLDMDFYQSTCDVLEFLINRMPAGAVAVLDDYGFFSEGVRTAVAEIMSKFPDTFAFENPFGSKFAVLTRL